MLPNSLFISMYKCKYDLVCLKIVFCYSLYSSLALCLKNCYTLLNLYLHILICWQWLQSFRLKAKGLGFNSLVVSG